jgi:hypothetical protein
MSRRVTMSRHRHKVTIDNVGSIAVWAARVKKNKFFSVFSFRRVNYIFHKLSVNTKHAQFRLCMSPCRIFVEKKY